MPPKVIHFSSFEFDLELRELRQSGVRVPLQHKPFRILELLLRQPGALVTRHEFAKELWPGLHVDFEHSLNSAVNTLRQALGDSPRQCLFIETRSGLGYRFIAPIQDAAICKPASSNDYLQGRFFLNKMTNEGIQRAIGCFQSALLQDPSSALVKTGLADAYCQLALSGTACTSEVSPPAREFASDAIRTQPSLPEAHISMGQVRMLFDWDWSRATEDWNHASRLDPAQPESHRAWARLLAARNCHADALREISRAQELAPLSLPIGFDHAWLLYLAGNFQEAAAQSWKVLSLEPAFAPAQTTLGLAYQQLGSFDEAITELENACTCSQRQPSALASLGHAYATAGLPDKARAVLGDLAAESQRRHVSAYCFALVHAGLGQLHLAIAALQTACTQRDPQLLWVTVDPRFALLHSEPDFLALSRHLNITAD